jgi:hypothetical protein
MKTAVVLFALASAGEAANDHTRLAAEHKHVQTFRITKGEDTDQNARIEQLEQTVSEMKQVMTIYAAAVKTKQKWGTNLPDCHEHDVEIGPLKIPKGILCALTGKKSGYPSVLGINPDTGIHKLVENMGDVAAKLVTVVKKIHGLSTVVCAGLDSLNMTDDVKAKVGPVINGASEFLCHGGSLMVEKDVGSELVEKDIAQETSHPDLQIGSVHIPGMVIDALKGLGALVHSIPADKIAELLEKVSGMQTTFCSVKDDLPPPIKHVTEFLTKHCGELSLPEKDAAQEDAAQEDAAQGDATEEHAANAEA